LGCYNGGELNGAWVAGTVAGDVSRAVKVKLGEPAIYGQNCLVCVKCGSDEFNVFDFENYGGLLSGECDPMTAQRMAELWEELEESDSGEELRAYAANIHLSLSDLGTWRDDFENAYVGTYGTWREYADSVADDVVLAGVNDETVKRYFDYDAWARDLAHDYTVLVLPDFSVAVFQD
jgi:antirestriction protein